MNTRTYHGIQVTRVEGGVERSPRWVAGPPIGQGERWYTRDHAEGDKTLWVEGKSLPRFELLAGQDRWQEGDTRPRPWVSVFDRTRPPIEDDWLARAQGWPGVNPWKVSGSLRDAAKSIAEALEAESEAAHAQG